MTTPTEISQYYSLGYNPATQRVTYLFVNPFRTPDNAENDVFKDHQRDIPVVITDGAVDIDATDVRVGEIARGVFNKMKIAADSVVPESLNDDALAAYGTLVTPPVEEDTSDTEGE
jgi:hypothetical protein